MRAGKRRKLRSLTRPRATPQGASCLMVDSARLKASSYP
jgi:hypothetical protein